MSRVTETATFQLAPRWPRQLLGTGSAYVNKTKNLGPIGLWPLSEAAANAVVRDAGANALHGANQMGVLMLGANRYYFHVGSIYSNLYSAGLSTKLSMRENGLFIRAKVRDASTFWTDGASHRFFLFGPDTNNTTTIRKDATSNPQSITYRRWGSSTNSIVLLDRHTETGWMTLASRCSESNDFFEAWSEGVQTGTTQHSLGINTGLPLDPTMCVVGATDTTGGNPMDGWLSDMVVTLNGVVPTADQMASISTKLAASTLTTVDLDTAFGSGNWAWWALSDVDATDSSRNNEYGRYNSATFGVAGIGDGLNAITLNGTSDYVNIWSPTLASAFNTQEGSLSAWVKPTWDTTTRYAVRLAADASNYVALAKTSTAGVLTGLYTAGGTVKQVNFQTGSPGGWLHVAVTWSKSNDRMIFYVAGAPRGTAQTSLGVWAGTIVDGNTQIGCQSIPFTAGWAGGVARVSLYNKELSAANITTLATVP